MEFFSNVDITSHHHSLSFLKLIEYFVEISH